MSALFKPPYPNDPTSPTSTSRQLPGDRMRPIPYGDPIAGNPAPPTTSSCLGNGNGLGVPQSKNTVSQANIAGAPTRERVSATVRNAPRGLDEASTVLSDADPESWSPGEKYAQYSLRRGGGGLQWRELSPVEGLRVMLHNNASRILRELDPQNAQLQSMNTSTWVPTFEDTNRLNEEIARVKTGRRLSDPKSHHNYPQQFAPNFRACGIEPEDYRMFLPRSYHRLRPDGLHTGPNNWNVQWREFLTERPDAKPNELFDQLHRMWKQVPCFDK